MNTYETGPSMMLSPILILDRRNRLPPVRTKPVAGYSFYFLFFLLLSTRIWSCNCQSLSTGEKVDVYIQEQIDSYDVMVFAKSYCPYCRHTRTLLQELREKTKDTANDGSHKRFSLKVLDIDKMPEEDGSLIQAQLLQRTSQRTVPNVFIAGAHVGGDDDLTELYNADGSHAFLEGLLSKLAKTAI